MATRGSAMSRAIKFFKEEDLDVALVALTHIRNIVDARSRNERTGMAKQVKRGRKPKPDYETKGGSGPFAGESLADA